MRLKDRAAGHHMDVVRAGAALVALDKKRIPRRNVVAHRGTPEVIVTLPLKNGSDLCSGRPQTGHFHEHVNDRLRGEAGNCRAAKVFDAPDE